MKTPNERKRDERERKRQSGLVLKQVWMPPSLWPVVQDLTTRENEAFVFSGRYTTQNDADHMTAYTYELARELWTEIAVQAFMQDIDQDGANAFGASVLRAMIKTMPANLHADAAAVKAAKLETFGEDDAD